MSVVDVINLIYAGYRNFKEAYKCLKQNEDDLRDLLDEVFLYESLITIYSQKVQESPDSSPYTGAIKLFSSGVVGLQTLLHAYQYKKKSLLKGTWDFCKSWCCAPGNSEKIKKYASDLTRAVNLLGFSADVLIMQQMDRFRLGQMQVQSQLCAVLELLKPDAVSADSDEIKKLSTLLAASEESVLKDIRENRSAIEQALGEVAQVQRTIDAARAEIAALSQAVLAVDDKVTGIGAGVCSLKKRLITVQSEIKRLFDAKAAAAGGGGQSFKSYYQHIVDEEARKFWAGYFPIDEEVPWVTFAAALRADYPALNEVVMSCLKKELDTDGDGRIHAREFNILTKRAGLAATIGGYVDAAGTEDADGKTALYRAARANNVEEVKSLVGRGANVNYQQTFCRTTPLHAAAFYGYVQVAKVLVEAGARSDIRNCYNLTALEEASSQGHTDIVNTIQSLTRVPRARACH